ncbi:MAG TPA: hypothetical protein VGH28_03340 [Polyangiaceae bacterium]|jgi:hypothetical protein
MRVAVLLLLAAGCSRPLSPAISPDSDAAAPQASQAALAPPAPPPPPPPSTPAPPQKNDDDLREAVLRHMFKKNASGAQQTAQVFCIHFEKNADPPPAFLARFSSNKTPVVAGRGCTEDARNGVTERATGKRGLAFRIDSISWTDADHAQVSGGYYEAGLSASGNVYTLERAAGVWTVTKDEMTWIS